MDLEAFVAVVAVPSSRNPLRAATGPTVGTKSLTVVRRERLGVPTEPDLEADAMGAAAS